MTSHVCSVYVFIMSAMTARPHPLLAGSKRIEFVWPYNQLVLFIITHNYSYLIMQLSARPRSLGRHGNHLRISPGTAINSCLLHHDNPLETESPPVQLSFRYCWFE